jgi:hypothetical protein
VGIRQVGHPTIGGTEGSQFGFSGENQQRHCCGAEHSPATVKRHLEDILRKLQLKNRVEAAIYGLMMRACAPGLDSQCPFALWRQTVLKDGRRFGRGNEDDAAALYLNETSSTTVG